MAKDDFHSLRSSTALAIKRSKGGANPFLTCNAIEALDPEFKDVANRLLTLRCYFVTFPMRKVSARQAFESLNPSMKKATGPYARLILALRKIHCLPVIKNNAFGIVTEFGFLNLETASAKIVKTICRYLWNLHLPDSPTSSIGRTSSVISTPLDYDSIHTKAEPVTSS